MDEGRYDSLQDLSSVISDSFLSRVTLRTKPVDKNKKKRKSLDKIQEGSEEEIKSLRKSESYCNNNNTSINLLNKLKDQSIDSFSISDSEPLQVEMVSFPVNSKSSFDVESFENESLSRKNKIGLKKKVKFNYGSSDQKDNTIKTEQVHRNKYKDGESSNVVQNKQLLSVNDNTVEGMEVSNESSLKRNKKPKSHNRSLNLDHTINETSQTCKLVQKQKRRNSIAAITLSETNDEKSTLFHDTQNMDGLPDNTLDSLAVVNNENKHNLKRKKSVYSGNELHSRDFEANDKIEERDSETTKPKNRHKPKRRCSVDNSIEHLHLENNFKEKQENEAAPESVSALQTSKSKKHNWKGRILEDLQKDLHSLNIFKQKDENGVSTEIIVVPTIEKQKKLKRKRSEDYQIRHIYWEDNFRESGENEATENSCDSPTVKCKSKHKSKHKHSEESCSGNLHGEESLKEKDENEVSTEYMYNSSTAKRKSKHKSKYTNSEDFPNRHLYSEVYLEDQEKECAATEKHTSDTSPIVVKHRKHSRPADLSSFESNLSFKKKKSIERLPSESSATHQVLPKNKKKKEKAHNSIKFKNVSILPKYSSKQKLLVDEHERKGPSSSGSSSSIIFENILKNEIKALYHKNLNIPKKKKKLKNQETEFIEKSKKETSNELEPKKISEPSIAEADTKRKKRSNRKKSKNNNSISTSENKPKKMLHTSLAHNDIDQMRSILLKKAMASTKIKKRHIPKITRKITSKKENTSNESSPNVEVTKLLGKAKQTKGKKDKHTNKSNKMDIRQIQQSLLSDALNKLNTEPNKDKSSQKLESPKWKISDDNCIKSAKRKKDKKIKGANDKTKKKARKKDEFEDITSKLLSEALASKQL